MDLTFSNTGSGESEKESCCENMFPFNLYITWRSALKTTKRTVKLCVAKNNHLVFVLESNYFRRGYTK